MIKITRTVLNEKALKFCGQKLFRLFFFEKVKNFVKFKMLEAELKLKRIYLNIRLNFVSNHDTIIWRNAQIVTSG